MVALVVLFRALIGLLALAALGGIAFLVFYLRIHAQFDLLANNAKAGCGDEAEAPINFAGAAGQQHVKRRIEGQQRRRVMHLTIRECDYARKPRPRHIRQSSAER